MSQTDRYADDVTSILIGQGLLLEHEKDEIRRYVRGW